MFNEEKKAIEDLDKRIANLSEEREAGQKKEKKVGGGNLDLAVRIISDLIAGVVVGLGIGMLIDNAFSTKPAFMIVFLFIGSIAGFLNVYRTFKKYEEKQELEDKMKDM